MAIKVAVEAPAGTVTEAGTVNELVLEASATVAPPVGAAPLRATMQPVEADAERDCAAQINFVSCAAALATWILPPVATTASVLPSLVDAMAFVNAAEPLPADEVSVNEMTETTPSGMSVRFKPLSTHVYFDGVPAQETSFPAAVAAGPAAAEIDEAAG